MKRVDFSLMRGNSMMCFVWRGRFGNKPLLREINGQPMGRKSTTPLISLSASLLAVWFYRLRTKAIIISNASCLPEGKAFEASSCIFDQGGPSWNTWMILAPITRLNIPKTGNRWRVAFWANRCHQGPGQWLVNLLLRETKWLINP